MNDFKTTWLLYSKWSNGTEKQTPYDSAVDRGHACIECQTQYCDGRFCWTGSPLRRQHRVSVYKTNATLTHVYLKRCRTIGQTVSIDNIA